MTVNKWLAVGAVTSAVAAVSVWANSSQFRVFRTNATITVSQTSSTAVPGLWAGTNLVALALAAQPTSNQVLAIAINCDSTAANLIVYDKSNSNMTTIAQSTSFDKVAQVDPATSKTNQERFVAQFEVQPVGNLVGGLLTVAGRLHLDTNGCVKAVLGSVDPTRSPYDKVLGILRFKDLDKRFKPGPELSGRVHFIGVLDVISNGQTNTVLIPTGFLSFEQQLDEFINE